MKHFVYRITILNNTDERKYYVGKHSGSLDDFENKKYFTSSKIVCPLLKNPETKFKVKIVKTFKTSKEALNFESKYHNRVNVNINLKFFNLQNQTLVHKSTWGDRTNLVTVLNKENGLKLNVSSKEFKKNKDKYISLSSNKVICIDVKTGKKLQVTREEFISNPDFIGIAKGLINVIDIRTGVRTRKTRKEIEENGFYEVFGGLKGKVSAFNIETGEKLILTKEEFDKNRHIYKGIQAKKGHIYKECPICSTFVQHANMNNHLRRHENSQIWVTDKNNFQSYKVKEKDFYLKYKDDYYLIEKNRDNTYGFFKGEKKNIRRIGYLNKKYNITLS